MSVAERYPEPPEGSLHRHFYDRAIRLGYPVDAFHTQVDAQIEDYNSQADEMIADGVKPREIAPELFSISHQLGRDIRDFIDEDRDTALEETGRAPKESTTSLRLRLLGRTAEHHLIWPIMAKYGRDNPDAKQYRRELSESMYGDTVDYLQFLMNPREHSLEFSDGVLRGAINEVTAIGLANRNAISNRIALLTPLADDFRKRVDFRHYRFNGDPESPQVTDVQVKSRHGLDLSHLRGVRILTARDMGNRYAANGPKYMYFETSRAMIREINGNATNTDIIKLDNILAQQAFRSIILDK